MGPKREGAHLVTYGKQPKKRRALPPSFFELDPEVSKAMSWIPAQHHPEPLVPKRPDSQKAATMAVEPDQGNVDMLSAIAGCDAHTARRYLKVSRLVCRMQSEC